jgi:hypothetical protein
LCRQYVDISSTETPTPLELEFASQGAVKSRGSAGFASFLVKNYPAISRNGLRITPELVNQPFT